MSDLLPNTTTIWAEHLHVGDKIDGRKIPRVFPHKDSFPIVTSVEVSAHHVACLLENEGVVMFYRDTKLGIVGLDKTDYTLRVLGG